MTCDVNAFSIVFHLTSTVWKSHLSYNFYFVWHVAAYGTVNSMLLMYAFCQKVHLFEFVPFRNDVLMANIQLKFSTF